MMNRMQAGRELSEKVPDEIFQLVESFRRFIREQKAYRDQKFDVDPILEVDREADEFMLAFQRVSVDSDTNSQLIQQIRNDTTKLLRHAELAYSLLRPYLANNPTIQQQQQQYLHPQQQQNQMQQQTGQPGFSFLSSSFVGGGGGGGLNSQTFINSPFGPSTNPAPSNQTYNIGTSNTYQTADSSVYLNGASKSLNQTSLMDSTQFNHNTAHHNQFANTCSSQYFADLADQFESRMKAYGEQIKGLKMSLDSVIKTYNADELFKWLKKQHETLGEIAAKVYMTHERIMEKKSELDRSTNNANVPMNQTKTINFT